MMAADMHFGQEIPKIGNVGELFQAQLRDTGLAPADMTSDGQRFLFNTSEENRFSAPMTLVLNWLEALRRRSN
jgi:hypothetical protein